MWDVLRDIAWDSPGATRRFPATGPVRLAWLRRQERQWFAWLTVLHERLGKDDSGALAEESRQVMEIAKKRWQEAKLALVEAERQAAGERGFDPQSASCTGRGES